MASAADLAGSQLNKQAEFSAKLSSSQVVLVNPKVLASSDKVNQCKIKADRVSSVRATWEWPQRWARPLVSELARLQAAASLEDSNPLRSVGVPPVASEEVSQWV